MSRRGESSHNIAQLWACFGYVLDLSAPPTSCSRAPKDFMAVDPHACIATAAVRLCKLPGRRRDSEIAATYRCHTYHLSKLNSEIIQRQCFSVSVSAMMIWFKDYVWYPFFCYAAPPQAAKNSCLCICYENWVLTSSLSLSVPAMMCKINLK